MNLEEWSTSLVRERYYEVCEEKNAYQQMQFEMSCEIDNKTQHLKAAEQAHTNIQKELAAAKKNWEETIGALQGMLVMVGVSLMQQ